MAAQEPTNGAQQEGEGSVRYERRKRALGVITLDRQARRNALSRAMTEQLASAVERAANDSEVRWVVITGAGERAFCAGADLKERADMSADEARGLLDLYRTTFTALNKLPKPTVAALNGAALGGGFELALACDFRVAARHAIMGLIETSLGIVPGAGGTQRLPRMIGEARAKELILLARRINVSEARNLGLLSGVTEDGEGALDCAERVFGEFGGAAPIALRGALEAIDAAIEMELEEGLDCERACYERTMHSEDRKEGIRAFNEKRAPRFVGR